MWSTRQYHDLFWIRLPYRLTIGKGHVHHSTFMVETPALNEHYFNIWNEQQPSLSSLLHQPLVSRIPASLGEKTMGMRLRWVCSGHMEVLSRSPGEGMVVDRLYKQTKITTPSHANRVTNLIVKPHDQKPRSSNNMLVFGLPQNSCCCCCCSIIPTSTQNNQFGQ